MGRGKSNLKIATTSSGTRGQKEYAAVAKEAQASGLDSVTDFSSLLSSSYSAGLDCSIDYQIIDQLKTNLSGDLGVKEIESLQKMIDIFQEQAKTKQQFQSVQLKLKTDLLKRIAMNKERLSPEQTAEIKKLDDLKSNADQQIHMGLLKSNAQYARFF